MQIKAGACCRGQAGDIHQPTGQGGTRPGERQAPPEKGSKFSAPSSQLLPQGNARQPWPEIPIIQRENGSPTRTHLILKRGQLI